MSKLTDIKARLAALPTGVSGHFNKERQMCICTSCEFARQADDDLAWAVQRIESLELEQKAMLLDIAMMLKQRWTFDNNQQHTHSWHDMQDCLTAIAKRAAKLLEWE